MVLLSKYATELYEAETSGIGISPISASLPNLSTEEAYSIQLENINRKQKEGHKVVGKKIGLTSKAMQQLLGVNEPDYGHLLDSMNIGNGEQLSFDKVMQPKVEGEIAFILKHELRGPNVSAMDVILATDYIVPALEIVDSRVKDWKITLQDTIADNASSGFFVLGNQLAKIDEVDLEMVGMVLLKNGEVMNTGVGAAALGNPIHCVAWLANRIADFDLSLKAGEVILSGALSAAVEAKEGDTFTAKFAHLGEVSVRF